MDEEPVAFSLSANTVLEDSAVGTVVGTFRAVDPEGGDLSFSLRQQVIQITTSPFL